MGISLQQLLSTCNYENGDTGKITAHTRLRQLWMCNKMYHSECVLKSILESVEEIASELLVKKKVRKQP